MAELFNFFIDGAVLFNIGIRSGNVGFRLVIIILGYKIFHGVFRKKLLELRAKLCRQGFVMCQHQRRSVDIGNDVCHGERFAGTRHAEQHLFLQSAVDSVGQFGDCLRLVAGRLIG